MITSNIFSRSADSFGTGPLFCFFGPENGHPHGHPYDLSIFATAAMSVASRFVYMFAVILISL